MNEKKTTRKRRQALESVPEAESVEASSSSQSNEKTSKRSNSGKSKIVESVEVSSSSQSNEKTSKRSNSDKSKISEAEVLSRLVPDCIADGLEILFVGEITVLRWNSKTSYSLGWNKSWLLHCAETASLWRTREPLL